MDIHISILYRTDGAPPPHHFGRLVIGKRLYTFPPNNKEVYWCCASGQNFFSCVDAVKKRAILWAMARRINDITGVTDEESLLVLVNTGKTQVVITPITFNNWILQPHLS